jgi:4-amino-4-deoxy-L-arabinose transferase-like glycosyltransferase
MARAGLVDGVDDLTIYQRGSYPAVYEFPQFYLAARLVSAVMGVGVVLLTYLLANRLGGRRQALMAAAVAAVLPALVIHSHFATPDTPLVFYTILALYLLVRVYDEWNQDNGWAYLGAGFVCGLAASTKYNGVLLALPLLLVPLLRLQSWDSWLRLRTLAGPLGMALGFFAGTPYAIANMPHFLYWFGYNLHLYNVPGHVPTQSGWLWQLEYHLTNANTPVFLLGIAGFLLTLRRWGRRGLMVNAFVPLFWLAIFGQTRSEARMWLPVAPLFAIWTAVFLDFLAAWLPQRITQYGWFATRPYASRIALLPLLALLLFLFASSVVINGRFQAQDVRTLTQKWVEANIPDGRTIAIDYFAPNLDTARWAISRQLPIFRDVTWYQEQGIQYIIVSEAAHDRAKMSAEEVAAWDTFTRDACLIETISGPFLSARTIHFWVYQVPPCS